MSHSMKDLNAGSLVAPRPRRREKPSRRGYTQSLLGDAALSRDEIYANTGKLAGEIIRVDPALCQPWAAHDRDKEAINRGALDKLKALIAKHGQKHPALGRIIEGQPDKGPAIELAYGATRWMAQAELGGKLVVRIEPMTDKDMAIQMLVENVHEAISPWERAVSMNRLSKHFGESESPDAWLEIPKSTRSKLNKIALLPKEIAHAFQPLTDLTMSAGYDIGRAWEGASPDARQEAVKLAVADAGKQSRTPARALTKALIRTLSPPPPPAKKGNTQEWKSAGRVVGVMQVDAKTRTTTLKLKKEIPAAVKNRIVALIDEWSQGQA